MKTPYLTTTAFAALLALSGQTNACEKELSKNEVPKAVFEAFEKAYPTAKEVEYEKEMFEDKAAYEVEYKENGKEYEFLYSTDGVLLQKEEEIEVSTLPESIVEAVKTAHPKATIEEVEKLLKPDGTLTGFEVKIKTPKRKAELEVDVYGKILKTEKE